MAPEPIRLLVVEDHPAIAQGLAGLLADELDLILVGIATTAQDASAVLSSERADVALCDIMLDGRDDGFELLKRYGGPGQTAFVMFSAHAFPGFYATAHELGAAGYLLKTATIEEIVAAIRNAVSGDWKADPVVVQRARAARRRPTAAELLTIQLVSTGRPNRAIAERQGISIKTVESRLRGLFDRYDVASRTELAALARREGWLPLDRR